MLRLSRWPADTHFLDTEDDAETVTSSCDFFGHLHGWDKIVTTATKVAALSAQQGYAEAVMLASCCYHDSLSIL